MSELPDAIYESVTQDSEAGNLYADNERYAEAASEWEKALALLPVPKKQWEAATWLCAPSRRYIRRTLPTAPLISQMISAKLRNLLNSMCRFLTRMCFSKNGVSYFPIIGKWLFG